MCYDNARFSVGGIMEMAPAVKSNEFEKLLEKIKVEREIKKNSELVMARKVEILKTIISVYFFLRVTLGMPHRKISIEEFEIAQSRLRLIAEEETQKRWSRFLGMLGIETWWTWYLRRGYFKNDYKLSVIGRWGYSPWNFRDFGCLNDVLDGSYNERMPPGAKELMEQIYSKKYGTANKLDKNNDPC